MMNRTHAEDTRMLRSIPAADSELLACAIQQAFHQTGRAWLQHLTVEVEDREVVLRGNVPSFYLKQLAQVAVLSVPGIARLRNAICVADRAP